MSKKNRREERAELRKKEEAEAAFQVHKRQERELRNSIVISTVIWLAIWTIIILGVVSAGWWGAGS
jgi:uncharacterized ion transporter superfamily protein YfcC